MDRGLVNLDYLRKKTDNADFYGKSAYCFIDGNKIIKIYARDIDGDYTILSGINIPDLSKYNDKIIVFPDRYIYDNGEKVGEIMDYIHDKSIESSLSDGTLIMPFLNNYEKACKSIKKYPNILMIDLCSINILYSNGNGFHIIDTSEWKLFDKNTVYRNVKKFNEHIIRVLFEYIDLPVTYRGSYPIIDDEFKKKAYKFGFLGKELFDIIEYSVHDSDGIKELLCAYRNLYQSYKDKELEKMSGVKEMTKVLKKG